MKPMHRSRSLKRKKVTTPGGRRTTHFTRRLHGKPHCPSCGQELHGVRFDSSASKNRTNRPYGGFLCSTCTRDVLRQESAQTGMLEVGKEALKIAGRDAGEKVKIVKLDANFAVVESRKKQRKVNVKHLEPL